MDARFQVAIFARSPQHIQNLGLGLLVGEDHLERERVVGVARLTVIDLIVDTDDAVNLVAVLFAPLDQEFRERHVRDVVACFVFHHYYAVAEMRHLLRRAHHRLNHLVDHEIDVGEFFTVYFLLIYRSGDKVARVRKVRLVFLCEYRFVNDEFAANHEPLFLGEFHIRNQVGDVLPYFTISARVKLRHRTLGGIEPAHSVQFTR